MVAITTDVDKRILLLTGKNYTVWDFWLKARLMKKGLSHVVNTGPTADEKQEECNANNATHSTSLSVLSPNQFCPGLLMQQVRRTCGRKL